MLITHCYLGCQLTDLGTSLRAEIRAFERWLEISKYEQRARKRLASDVVNALGGLLGDANIAVFGSSRTGMGFITSDIDLVLVDSENIKEQRRHWSRRKRRNAHFSTLRKFQRRMSINSPDFTSPVLCYATYPLITMQHSQTGVDIQIVTTDIPQQPWVSQFQRDYPAFRSVYFIVKSILEARGLTNVYRGGLGGYSTLGMIAASFRLHPDISECDAVGHLLAFLEFFSHFDTITYGIDPTTPQIFEKTQSTLGHPEDQQQEDAVSNSTANSVEGHDTAGEPVVIDGQNLVNDEKIVDTQDSMQNDIQAPSSVGDAITSESQETHQQSSYSIPERDAVLAGRERIVHTDLRRPYLLCLQDPADPTNDLGSKSFAIKHIIATFRHLHRVLQSSVEPNLSFSSPTDGKKGINQAPIPTSQGYSLLLPLVGASLSAKVTRRRRQLVDWYCGRAHWKRDADIPIRYVKPTSPDSMVVKRAWKTHELKMNDQLKNTARAWTEQANEIQRLGKVGLKNGRRAETRGGANKSGKQNIEDAKERDILFD